MPASLLWDGRYSLEERHQFSKSIWGLKLLLRTSLLPPLSRLLLALSNQLLRQVGSLQIKKKKNVDSSEMSNSVTCDKCLGHFDIPQDQPLRFNEDK